MAAKKRSGDTRAQGGDAPSEEALTEGTGPAAVSFEQSIARLGEIVELLEGGELPLEDSLRRFEEGVRIARRAQAVLDAAEQRVEQLLSVDEQGNPVVRELEEPPQ